MRSHALRLTKITVLPDGRRQALLRTAMGRVREMTVAEDVLANQERFGRAVKAATGSRLWTEPSQETWADLIRYKAGNCES